MRAMYAVGTLLRGALLLVDQVLTIYWWIVLIAVLISWVNPSPYNPVVQFLQRMTQPVFAWVRRNVPGMMRLMFQTGFDLSPIVVFLGIWFVQQVVIRELLLHYVDQLRVG
jgi:YggT family protein